MRIQHNIMAMNAYRNYNTNTSALSKNLEKLSSGYKINRAGDDAAGLAISEKMRAQITGLNAASKNVKDGISLVKTAEGAMQEIQDMLNRMDYLATQSANGTYDNPVDRLNLNKEMDALKEEINRIAESANFNGIKLLNGSLDPESTPTSDAQAAADAAQAAADAAQAAADEALAKVDSATGELVFGKEEDLPIHTTMATNNTPSTSGAAETVLETDYKATDKPGFSVTFNGMSHVFADPTATGKTTAGEYVSIKINDGAGDTEIKLQEADIAAAYKEVTGEDAKKGDTASAEVLAKAAAKFIETTGAKIGGTGQAAGEFEITGANKFTAKADGDRLVFEAKDAKTDLGKVPNFTVKFQGVTQADVAAEGPKFTTGAITQTGTTGNVDQVATVTYTDADGVEKTKDITFKSGADADAATVNFVAALNADIDLNKLFTATGTTGAGGATLATKATDNKAAVTKIEMKTPGTGDVVGIAAGKAEEAHGDYKTGTFGYTNSGTPVTVQTGTPQIDQLASTVVTLDNTQVVDGAVIRLGDQSYIFSIGEDSKYKDAENVIRVEDMVKGTDYTVDADGKVTLQAGAGLGLEKYLDKLVEVAKDNKTFSVSQRATTGEIGLKQLAEVKDTTDMSTKEKLQSYIGITTVDADATAQSAADAKAAAQADADALQATAKELQAKADEMAAAVADAKANGKPLTLQIGDTSDGFNQLGVKVGDMHVSAMGAGKLNEGTEDEKEITKTIADIDIKSQDAAHEAIDVIKNAINYVSGVRGDLGAVQNRLEHTANNLSVMTENIQDAESTIRDTDIAEEMMAYTKNNILVQSAQAMLAQANAVPQGVLQLLG